MLDIGWPELFLIGVVALIVVGPKDLPKALRTAAQMLHKARAMSREFQSGLAEIAREAELDELKRNVEGAARFNPAEELKRAVDPTGTLTEDFDPAEFNRKIKAAVEGGPPARPASPLPQTPETPRQEAPPQEDQPSAEVAAALPPRPAATGDTASGQGAADAHSAEDQPAGEPAAIPAPAARAASDR
jgi:sec-independent protein translocase protein TatB